MTESEAETMAKFLKPAGIVLLVFFIATRPDSASQIVRRIGGVVGDIAGGLSQFVSNVFS